MSQSNATLDGRTIKLFQSLNSDCSTRLRLALAWKGLKYTSVDCGPPGDLSSRPDNYIQLNPSSAVPTLVIFSADGCSHSISQSIAAMEYLDEVCPTQAPLLPKEFVERAQVRALVGVIAIDTHPLTAPRVERQIVSQFGDSSTLQRAQADTITEWRREWNRQGLETYESLLESIESSEMRYSVGDDVSLADICLLAQAWRAQTYGIELAEYPLIQRIVARLEEIECLRNAHWDRQGGDKS